MYFIIGFILGAVLGSFTGVLSERSLTKKTFWGRSYCLHCKKNLSWYDLFPIISYIFLKGRCRYCQKRIKTEYLVVEVVMGILVGFLFWQNSGNFSADLIYKTFFICILVALFITDLKEMLIPDRISLPAIYLSTVYLTGVFLYNYLFSPNSGYSQFYWSLMTGATIAGFFMFLIIITRGKGMGGGDVKLGALIGLALGFPQGLVAVILSFVTGAVFSIFLIITGKKHFGQAIPFGPFLVLGSLITLFFGNRILDWYLHFI